MQGMDTAQCSWINRQPGTIRHGRTEQKGSAPDKGESERAGTQDSDIVGLFYDFCPLSIAAPFAPCSPFANGKLSTPQMDFGRRIDYA